MRDARLPAAAAAILAPGRRREVLRAFGVALFFLAVFLLPLPEALKRWRWLDIPGNLVHVPLMGLAAWALQRRGPLRGRPLWAAAGATGCGLAIELLQATTGREANLTDLMLDACGAFAVGCWLRAAPGLSGGARARRAWLAAAALSLAPAVVHLAGLPPLLAADALSRRRFPLLADFETRTELGGWYESHQGRLSVVPRAGGGVALRLEGSPPQVYPGAYLKGFPRDWTGLTTLEFDARCVGADSVRLIVRADDFLARKDGAWLAGRFAARPHWQRFAWTAGTALGRRPARPQDRRDMNSLTFYIARPASPVAVEIDNLRLR